MGTLGVTNIKVTVKPKRIKQTTHEVTVRIEIPLDENSFVPNQFIAGKSIIRELTLNREGPQ